jgi:hypothetical protein
MPDYQGFYPGQPQGFLSPSDQDDSRLHRVPVTRALTLNKMNNSQAG